MAAYYGFLLVLMLISVILKLAFPTSAVNGEAQMDMKCQHMPFELGLILDSSSSLGKTNFKRSRELFIQLVQSFDIGPEKTRVALVMFGTQIYTDTSFNLESFTKVEDIITAINSNTYHRDEHTQTGEGLEYMRKHLLNSCVTRPNVVKICVIVTDMVSQHPNITKSASAQAAADGIHIIVVGVGDGVDKEELLTIAYGHEEMVITTNHFENLKAKVKSLLHKSCQTVDAEESQVPPSRVRQECGEINPTDVYFVLDQSALGSDDARQAADLITRIVQTDALRPAFRFGLISDVCLTDVRHKSDNARASVSPGRRNNSHYRYSEQYRTPSLRFPSHGEHCDAESNRNKVLVIDFSGQGIQMCGGQTLIGQPNQGLLDDLLSHLC